MGVGDTGDGDGEKDTNREAGKGCFDTDTRQLNLLNLRTMMSLNCILRLSWEHELGRTNSCSDVNQNFILRKCYQSHTSHKGYSPLCWCE